MISDKDYGLTKDGRVVEQTDVECASVLVGKGCEISDKMAEKYGLMGVEKTPEPEEKPKGGLTITKDPVPEKVIGNPPKEDKPKS